MSITVVVAKIIMVMALKTLMVVSSETVVDLEVGTRDIVISEERNRFI